MDVVRLGLRVVALLVLGVLGRDAGHALPDVALHAGDAPARDDGRGAECHRVRPEAQRLDRVDPVPDPAHQHDLDVLAAPDLLERVDRFDDGGKRRHPDVVDHLGAARAGRALHPVELDEVEAVLDRDLDVVAHPACPELDAHGQAVSGRLAHLLDLDEEIVAAEDVGVARREAQVDAGGNAADAGELGGFVGEQEERRSCPCWTQCPAPSTSQVPVQSAASFRNEAGGEAIP